MLIIILLESHLYMPMKISFVFILNLVRNYIVHLMLYRCCLVSSYLDYLRLFLCVVGTHYVHLTTSNVLQMKQNKTDNCKFISCKFPLLVLMQINYIYLKSLQHSKISIRENHIHDSVQIYTTMSFST